MIKTFTYSLYASDSGKISFSKGDKKSNKKFIILGKVKFSIESKENLPSANFYLSTDGILYVRYIFNEEKIIKSLKKVFVYENKILTFPDFKSGRLEGFNITVPVAKEPIAIKVLIAA